METVCGPMPTRWNCAGSSPLTSGVNSCADRFPQATIETASPIPTEKRNIDVDSSGCKSGPKGPLDLPRCRPSLPTTGHPGATLTDRREVTSATEESQVCALVPEWFRG